MTLIKPEEKGWTGLSYYYHLYTGWYEESPWVVNDIKMTIEQLKTINYTALSNISGEVFKLICGLLQEALDDNFKVWIVRE